MSTASMHSFPSLLLKLLPFPKFLKSYSLSIIIVTHIYIWVLPYIYMYIYIQPIKST